MIDAYLERIGLTRDDLGLPRLVREHVRSIPYENLDIHLGREIRIDVDSLVAKLVTGRRGGYCFEQNTLFAAALESLGHSVTRFLGRVRVGDTISPRPATHMVLRVGDEIVDVGFGSATPLGPVPLDGQATYGSWTWRTSRVVAPEGDEVWAMSCGDLLMYTFSDEPRHPVDYVTPNHFSATHPMSVFTQTITVQRSQEDVQLTLRGCELWEFRPGEPQSTTVIDPADLGDLLRNTFRLDLPEDDLGALTALLGR